MYSGPKMKNTLHTGVGFIDLGSTFMRVQFTEILWHHKNLINQNLFVELNAINGIGVGSKME